MSDTDTSITCIVQIKTSVYISVSVSCPVSVVVSVLHIAYVLYISVKGSMLLFSERLIFDRELVE